MGRLKLAGLALILTLLGSGCAGPAPRAAESPDTAPAATFAATPGDQPPGVAIASPSPDLSTYPWVFLRNGIPLAASETAAEVTLVGDVNLGRGVIAESDPLGAVAPWLISSDMTIGNLECAIQPPGAPITTPSPSPNPSLGIENTRIPHQPYFLIAPPASANKLRRAGFDIMSMANNHALDRGLQGLADTGNALLSAGITPLGAAPNANDLYTPVVKTMGGVKLAFLAFNLVPSPRGPQWSGEVLQEGASPGWVLAGWDPEKALAAVRSAHDQADAVIVLLHWGYEYERRIDPAQSDIAHKLASAGADLIVGTHPHVAQPIIALSNAGVPSTTLVAYSLGNFVFDQGFGETGQGLALRAFFDRKGLRAVQALGVRAGTRPALLPADQAERLLQGTTPAQPSTLAFRCGSGSCKSVTVPQTNMQVISQAVSVDLSGDGQPEQVSFKDGRVHISGPGLPDWSSPPDWQVLDLAAGDPNQDGRQELALALLKPDRSGVLLSHPYIFGYRQGQYRLLWGGSAVSDPIREIEVGDVDGDGLQELVVLEDLHAGQGQAFSLWRWNGWGFSQVWRSPSGEYSHLRLADASGSPIILVNSESDAR